MMNLIQRGDFRLNELLCLVRPCVKKRQVQVVSKKRMTFQ